jgi:hypothetical protein
MPMIRTTTHTTRLEAMHLRQQIHMRSTLKPATIHKAPTSLLLPAESSMCLTRQRRTAIKATRHLHQEAQACHRRQGLQAMSRMRRGPIPTRRREVLTM